MKIEKVFLLALVSAFIFSGCCGGENDDVIYRTSSYFCVEVKDTEGTPLGGIYCTLRNDKISTEPLAYGDTEPYPIEEYHGEPGRMTFLFGTGKWEKDDTNVYVISDKLNYELSDEDSAEIDVAYAMCNLKSGTPTDYYIVINDSSAGKQNDAYETDRVVYFSDFESSDNPDTKITLESK